MKNKDGNAGNTGFAPHGSDGVVCLADRCETNEFLIVDKAVADFKNRAISAIIDLDLPPDAMQTVLRTIKKLK